jgi:hypothetical protein
VTIRSTFFRLLSRGEVPQNPHELVEIAVLPLAVGPMCVDTLCNGGFHATGAPTFNIATDIASDYRVLVPRQEAAAATRRLDEIR